MDDRTAAFARGVEQPGDVGHGLVHARQLQGPTEVLLLRIDDDQAGVAQLGRRVIAASEAEHRGWNGHQGLLGRAFVHLFSLHWRQWEWLTTQVAVTGNKSVPQAVRLLSVLN